MSEHDAAQRAEELLLKKRALLFRQLQAKHDREQLSQAPIARQSRETSVFRVSFAQQRLWLLDQLQPGTSVYNISAAVQLSGALDATALQLSLNAVVARHEVLRTTFAVADGQPVQVIAAAQTLPLPLLDLRALPADVREEEAVRLVNAEARRSFDLACGPLLRAMVLRLDKAEHMVLLTLHHIVSDGWSTPILIQELRTLYAAFVAGQPSPLPELPIQYADYAVWQRAYLQGEVLRSQLAYWCSQLAGLPVIALPTDHPRPPVETFSGADEAFALAPLLRDELLALSQAEEATPFMTLLAAWQVLLARYSGQDDMVVGTPIANRTRKETQPLIGFFVNTLVLRTDLSGAPGFRELLQRVRRVCLGAYAHQDLPFEQIVEALQPARDLSRNPLFQVMFTLDHAPAALVELPGLALRPLKVESEAIQFDLGLSLVQSEAGLAGTLEYRTDLFDAATIARLLGHFQTLLQGIAAQPAQPWTTLPLLTAAERQQLLVEWNDTTPGVRGQGSGVSSLPPDPWCVHDQFAAQVEWTPDAIALVFDRPTTNDQRPTTNDIGDKETRRQGDKEEKRHTTDKGSVFSVQRSAFGTQQLTYHALDARANQLAHHLQGMGVGPEVPVALCLERSPELVVGLLGVLKAGGAILPLDPAAPPARHAFMLADSRAPILLTQTALDHGRFTIDDLRLTIDDLEKSDIAIVNRKSKIVNLDADWPHIAKLPSTPPSSTVTAAHLAYLIYTSGTTGAPKAVLASHHNLAQLLRTSQAHVACQPGDRMPWLAAVAFDIALFELFTPLLAGATLHILAPTQVLELPRLAAALTQVTMLHCVPSLLQQLVPAMRAMGEARAYARLRLVLVGGEAVPPALLDELAALFPAAQLGVLYGPTEATILATHYRRLARAAVARQLIGRPLEHLRVRVLDRQGQLVPLGVVGELYIGGQAVTRGYLGRPDLTAERFVPDPFGNCRLQIADCRLQSAICNLQSAIGERLYKTGDLVRYRADGQLEFVGRSDDQVKLRGFRIELGEIETVLRQHKAVGACVVLARADAPSTGVQPELRLVAYVVPTNDQRPTTNDHSADRERGRGGEWEDSNLFVSPSPSLLSQSPSFLSDLRNYLKQKLPEYMLPSSFVLLDALPLTPHGKVDRKALPAPESARPSSEEAAAVSRTPIEELLIQTWADVLRREPIGIHDNFFELGGHSLLATQLIARVRDTFQVDLPLRDLFAQPTPAGLAALIAQARRDVPGLPPPLQPTLRDGPLPLSYAQQRLWFIDQLQPNTPAYNIPIAVRLAGRLDTAALRHSLNTIVRRHEILRTTFVALDGLPVQRIAPERALALPLLDLRALPVPAREGAARRLARDEARRSFDLPHGPLLRAALLKLDGQEHIALLTMHHIIADAWSMDVLVRELSAIYAATVAGEAAPLPDLPIQYGDYAIWQRTWLQGAGDHAPSPLQAQLAYWQQQLAGLPTLDLPTDHPRPPVQTFRGASQGFGLSSTLSTELVVLSRRAQVTLFMTLLAAWQTLLARYSRQDDIAVGTPVAGRTHTATEHLIGCFINTLVLRTDLSGTLPFRNLLGRVREVCLQAYAHQELPFEQIVDALQPERGLNRNPLFQVLFSLQNTPPVEPALPDLALRPLAVEQGTTQFDLLLSIEEGRTGLVGTLDYSTDLFDATTITRMLGHFQTLLAGIAAQPQRRIADLPLLTAAERHQVVVDWNDTLREVRSQESGVRRTPLDSDRLASDSWCVHQLFEAQAERTPDAVAVVFDATTTDHRPPTNDQRPTSGVAPSSIVYRLSSHAQHLTYHGLNARANRLAHYLRGFGVGPDVRVAVYMEHALDLMIGLLGILKAGGAYLPLDPTYPAERLAFMLDDAQAAVILTQEQLADSLPTSWAYVVRIDSDWDQIARSPADNPDSGARPGNLAYVIYTSGSTGEPKGVLIPHQGLTNYLQLCAQQYLAPAGRGAPLHSPLGFDLTVTSLFAPLLAGQTVALLSEHESLAALSSALQLSNGWSLAKLTPAHLELLGQHLPPAAAWHVYTLIIGGEALQGEQLAFWRAHAPATRLINEYGPTETVVGCCVYTVPTEHPPVGVVPIGRPIANAQVYLLDRHMQPMPLGVPGELYIGGVQLARGYLNRPDLTAERFVPNPFSNCKLQIANCRLADSTICNLQSAICNRLYRTGDLARYRPDGNLEFLGRTDRQIKLRGFRIELGEVEAVLARHPAVRASVVLAREDHPGNTQLVAYVVTTKDERRKTKEEQDDSSFVLRPSSFVHELRDHLRQRVPAYMIPSAFVLLDALPLTANGKIDHAALPAPDGARPASETPFLPPRTDLERRIAAIWQDVLHLEAVGVHDNFFDLGGHSLLMVQVLSQIRASLLADLSMLDLFQYPTISALATFLSRIYPDIAVLQQLRTEISARQDIRARRAVAAAPPIAIIAMSGRFPGAATVEDFWRNLRDGVESVSFFSDEELIAAGTNPALVRNPRYVKAHAALDGIELFDAAFFGYAPREAEIMDPQHRLFLECAWEALERAGYDPKRYPGRIGVYAGVSMNSYIFNLLAAPDVIEALDGLQIVLGNDKDFLSTRISYKLNLSGPSVAVQTACSTSLVAVHLACKSLRDGESDMVLAGGVSLGVPQTTGYLYTEGGIGSPDGHCRAFDARAQGAISGSGLGIVVLRRLDDALADGDPILAVITGSAINNDGSLKVGYTAPSVAGQAAVIAEAQAIAGVDAASVQYVEGHGTATALGDQVEVAALTRAFRIGTDKRGFCALGSVKTNIGHLDAAAGAAGLIKTVLALQHRQIPPSLHFEEPNPQIDFAASPFYVNTALAEWPANGAPRRAAVSAFGLGGTNAHIILEEAPPPAPAEPSRPWQLMLLSARSAPALERATDRLCDHLQQHHDQSLADVAYTLQVGRKLFEHRRLLVCRDREDAIQALAARDPRRLLTQRDQLRTRSVVFLCAGLGDHYLGMGWELYQTEPAFREQVDRCAQLLQPHLGLDLRDVLYPQRQLAEQGAAPPWTRRHDDGAALRRLLGREQPAEGDDAAARRLQQTTLAQPAVFVLGYALAQLWMRWGVQAEALIGHSLGEYVAACLAGVLDLEDALFLVVKRAQLIEELPEGAMLAVALGEQELRSLLEPQLSLSAVNGPAACVVAGPAGAVAALEAQLAARGQVARRLPTRHAFHSAMLEGLAERFAELVASVRLHRPRLPYISNVTGTWIEAAQATDPRYWARHLCETVRFSEGLQTLLEDPDRILLEVGPGRSLSMLAKQNPDSIPDRVVLASMQHQHDRHSEVEFLLNTLGQLWLAGCVIDWSGVYAHERRRRVLLPTYPFERQRYWVEPARRSPDAPGRADAPPTQLDLADWFSIPIWKQSPPLRPAKQVEPARWLVLSDASGLGAQLAQRLAQAQHQVSLVRAGDGFARLGEREFTLDPRRADDYIRLLDELRALDAFPDRIVHLWSVTPDDATRPAAERFEPAQELGCYSLLLLAQALAQQRRLGPVRIAVVTNSMQEVADGELLCPEKATILGPCKVIPQEHSNITCQSIDIALPAPGQTQQAERIAGQLLAELLAQRSDPVIAYRGNQRWVQLFEAVLLDSPDAEAPHLRDRGVYLITGGLGVIGLLLADYLARTVRARLVLVGHSPFPERSSWDRWLAHATEHDATARRIRSVLAIQAAGAEVLIARGDVADPEQMRMVLDQVAVRYGELHGVIHAAGVTGELTVCPVQETDREVFARHFRAKVHGLFTLAQQLRGYELDFCLLCSSLSPILGGLGFSAYAAANAFMDAFAQVQSQAGATPWISVGWDGWRLDEEHAQQILLGGRGAPPGIPPREGVEAFARIVSSPLGPRIVVSTADLHERIAQWVERISFAADGQAAPQERPPQHPRPALHNEYVAPRGEVERQVAAIWQDILGIEPIGIYDDFFTLGGHSLLAIQILSRLRDALEIELPLRKIFESSTVADLAEQIMQAREADIKPQQPAVVPVARAAYRVKRSTLPGADHDPRAKEG